jgi:large subunit ribosomal protein L17
MRHKKKTVKLGRTSAHRDALMGTLVCSLISEKRIKTTLPKAKAARSLADKMVTLGKRGTLAARRQAISKLRRKRPVAELFDTIAPAYQDRQGGYTRILKLGKRAGDNAEMALLEWVDLSLGEAKTEKKEKKAPAAKKKTSKKKKDEDK